MDCTLSINRTNQSQSLFKFYLIMNLDKIKMLETNQYLWFNILLNTRRAHGSLIELLYNVSNVPWTICLLNAPYSCMKEEQHSKCKKSWIYIHFILQFHHLNVNWQQFRILKTCKLGLNFIKMHVLYKKETLEFINYLYKSHKIM